MNPVLSDLLSTNQVINQQGQVFELHSNISAQTGQMIQKWIGAVNCVQAVEVGLAFGVSSLYILDKLKDTANARLFGIDPMQFNDRWHGLGLENIKRAGFDDMYHFYQEPSYLALSKMCQAEERFQFALIDGWHTFDYVLVDFFFIDKMLDVGGVIVFDDVGYKAIRKAVTFLLSNLDYEFVDGIEFDRLTITSTIKRRVKSSLTRLSRDDWTPNTRTQKQFDLLAGMQNVVVEKKNEDARLWNHFNPF